LLECELLSGSTFVDTGANVDAYTRSADRFLQGPGRIVAIGSKLEMRRRLDFNLSTNGVDDVDVFRVALSDALGFDELVVKLTER
jgi:hypothetical protein